MKVNEQRHVDAHRSSFAYLSLSVLRYQNIVYASNDARLFFVASGNGIAPSFGH
jgi:hypothetical protein